MRILFMGTPDFSVPCLEALVQSGYEVCAAVTQPDKPKGRGHKLQPPPVKETAQRLGIEVFQPATLRDGAFAETAGRLVPDAIIVTAYGKILPKELLTLPPLGCINIHASLLPKYRGAAPIQRCIIDGESETGITSMYMEEGLDTGDMLIQKVVPISPEETAEELHDRLSVLGAEVLIDTLDALECGTLTRTPQDDSASSYAPMITKETGRVDWNKSAREIVNLIRGCNSWPAAHTLYGGTPLKLLRASVGAETNRTPGSIIGVEHDCLAVAAGDGRSVLVSEVQFPDSKRMSVKNYLNGHTIDISKKLEG